MLGEHLLHQLVAPTRQQQVRHRVAVDVLLVDVLQRAASRQLLDDRQSLGLVVDAERARQRRPRLGVQAIDVSGGTRQQPGHCVCLRVQHGVVKGGLAVSVGGVDVEARVREEQVEHARAHQAVHVQRQPDG